MATTELPLIVGCRYSHDGGLHGRDLAPLRRGIFVRGPNRERGAGGLTANLEHGFFQPVSPARATEFVVVFRCGLRFPPPFSAAHIWTLNLAPLFCGGAFVWALLPPPLAPCRRP